MDKARKRFSPPVQHSLRKLGLPEWPFRGQILEIWLYFRLVGRLAFLGRFHDRLAEVFLLAVFENMFIFL